MRFPCATLARENLSYGHPSPTSTHVVVLVSAPCMLPEVVLNPEKFSGLFRFWNRFTVNFIWCRKPEVMGTMAKFSKHKSLSAVKKDK